MINLRFSENLTNAASIFNHFVECDSIFTPPLSTRVKLFEYAQKLATKSDRFEIWQEDRLVGLAAAYIRNSKSDNYGFISNLSVCKDLQGRGLGRVLIQKCIALATDHKLHFLKLEVSLQDKKARTFYEKNGFFLCKEKTHEYSLEMYRRLPSNE